MEVEGGLRMRMLEAPDNHRNPETDARNAKHEATKPKPQTLNPKPCTRTPTRTVSYYVLRIC